MTEEEIWEQQQMRKAEERRQEDAEMERLEQERLARAERSPSLTEAEQLAIAWAAREADEWDEEDTPEVAAHAEVLRGLARRLF
jgi:hypothetical protein